MKKERTMTMHYFDKKMQEKIPGTPAYRQKQQSEQRKRDIFLLNQRLQKLTPYTPYSFVKEHETLLKVLQKANRHTVQCSILSLQYRNNFENLQVAIATVEFLLTALSYLSEEKQNKVKIPLTGILQDLQRLDYHATRHLKMER